MKERILVPLDGTEMGEAVLPSLNTSFRVVERVRIQN